MELKIPFSEAFFLQARRRFEELEGGVKSVSETTWFRWIGFILGPLPQAIRIASFQGVFWTKAIGFMFLLDWVLVEVIVLIVSWGSGREEYVQVENSNIHSPRRDQIKALYQGELFEIHLARSFMVPKIMVAGLMWNINQMSGKKAPAMGIPLWVRIFVHIWGIVLIFVVAELISYLFLRIAINTLCNIFPKLGRCFLISLEEGDRLFDDKGGAFYFSCFIRHFLICFLGYKYFYDSAGTINPGWTAIWG